MNNDARNLPGSVVGIASDWVTRIHARELGPDEERDLKRWLEQDERHVAAFQRMTDLLERSRVPVGTGLSTADRRPRRAVFRQYRPILATAAAAIVAAALILMLPRETRYETGVGEMQTVNLEDGSVLFLNALSDIRVAFESDRRVVDVAHGEIVFDVEPDAGRPFIVRTDAIDLQVTGTIFEVSTYDGESSVAVLEGSVAVETAGSGGRGPAIVVAANAESGRRLVAEGQSLGQVEAFDKNKFAAWRDGWLYHEGLPLASLVDRLNRQYHGGIRVADPGLAATRVNVALRLTERREMLTSLGNLLPVTVEEMPDGSVMIRAAE